MSGYFSALAICMTFLAATPASAQLGVAVGLADVTADGTWDCTEDNGTNVGAVVIADKTYAFIKPDGKLGGYGKLYRVSEDYFDLPVFSILDGYLKDEWGAAGFSMRGPKSNNDDLSGELFLNLIVKDDLQHECTRRLAP